MPIKQLIDLEKVRTENLKFRTDSRSSRSNYGWLVSNTLDDHLQRQIAKKYLQIENLSSSCQRWSLWYGFQTKHFICYLFGCKLWLQLIQNQFFVNDHLMYLLSSSKQVAARSDCCLLANTLCLWLPVWPAQGPKLCWSAAQELCHWFCSQNLMLQLSSGIAFVSDWQMTDRGLNLDSTLNSAAWPTCCKGSICSEVPE